MSPSPEEELQLQTVNHKLRTAIIGGIVCGLIAAAALYLGLR